MKKLLIICLMLFAVPTMVLAYTPTESDRDLIHSMEERLASLYPTDVMKLVRLYDTLDSKKVSMRVADGARGLYIREQLKDMLHEQLFQQSEVCIPQHAQWGDMVEVQYAIHTDTGELVRATDKPLAFNPGKGQMRASLERSVLGMQVATNRYRSIETVGIIASEIDSESIQVARDRVELDALGLTLGQTYAFGVNHTDKIVLGKVTALDDTMVTFDFTDAKNGDTVYMSLSLDRLRKACTQ